MLILAKSEDDAIDIAMSEGHEIVSIKDGDPVRPNAVSLRCLESGKGTVYCYSMRKNPMSSWIYASSFQEARIMLRYFKSDEKDGYQFLGPDSSWAKCYPDFLQEDCLGEEILISDYGS